MLKQNLPWIAPTAAILIVGFTALDRESPVLGFLRGSDDPAPAQPVLATAPAAAPIAPAAVAPTEDVMRAQEQARVVNTLNTYVDAAVSDPAPQAPAAQPVAVQPAVTPPAPAPQVTRAEPADLLSVTPAPAPTTAAVPVASAAPAIGAEFFANAQSKLAIEKTCGDDLQALAAQTQVYFPSGGLSGGAAGMNGARLIANLASQCPGYTLQVEGHSDAIGNPQTNIKLSKDRALSVINRLAASGIDTEAFSAVGYGSARPSGITGPLGREYYDRRVEFSVVQVGRVASLQTTSGWSAPLPGCAPALQQEASALTQYFPPGAVTVPTSALAPIIDLAANVARCEGVRLRIVGHHTDNPGTREDVSTGRMRALVMRNALATKGLPSEQLLAAAPSYSAPVPGQPSLPRSRIDFQVVQD